jgi:hypothetical protein
MIKYVFFYLWVSNYLTPGKYAYPNWVLTTHEDNCSSADIIQDGGWVDTKEKLSLFFLHDIMVHCLLRHSRNHFSWKSCPHNKLGLIL